MKSKTSFFNDTIQSAFGTWTPPTVKAAFPGDYFNKTLYLKNLTRYWPLWGMASLGGALFPLAMTLAALRYRETLSPLEFAGDMYSVLIFAVPIIMLCYCILCAMAVWSYLYNPRSVGLMHTLPVRREGLFVTNFLSGLTMVAIPCVATGLFTVLLSLVMHGFSAKAFLVTIAAVAGEGFFYFSAATATAFITGNAFALPALYFIFQFIAPLLDLLVSVFSSNLIFGLRQNGYTGLVEWLSPTVYLMQNVNVRRLYDIPFPDDGLMRNYLDHWTGVSLENGWLIGAYALSGVFWAAVAWLLYRRRRSESAGDVIAVGWLKPVFQACVTGVCALGGGQLLYLILVDSFDHDGGNGYALIPLILCMTFAGAIGYYAAAMLLAKTLRVFNKKSLTGIGATMAGCAVLCSLLYFDVFGAMNRIPFVDSLNYLHFYAADNNYYLYAGEDDALIEQIRDLHRAIVEDRQHVQTFRPWRNDLDGDSWAYENITLDYRLKSGREVHRTYPLYLSRERMETEGTFDQLLDALVNSTAMRQKRLHAGDPRFRPTSGGLFVERRQMSYDLSSRELAALLTALGRDAVSGAWGQYDWFDNTIERYAISLNMEFEASDAETEGVRDWDYTHINIQSGMDYTIAALKDLGYITDVDLITYDEFNELAEKYGIPVEQDYGMEEAITEDGQYVAVPASPTEGSGATLVPEPVQGTEETGAVRVPGAADMDPNSYTPPASSGSLDVSASASDGASWPGTNWDENADPSEVDQYADGAEQ